MKLRSIVAVAVTIVSLVVILNAGSALAASSGYESGYNHGVSDAKSSGQMYISQPGKGFEFHSKQFVKGYIDGWCATTGGGSSDADQASFDCSKGFSSAHWIGN
jgi:hypothetical protein